jgi:PAS domain-containing protein
LYDDPARTLQARHFTPEEWIQLREKVIGQGRYEQEMELRRYNGETFWATVELTSVWLDNQSYFLVRLTDTNRLHLAERDLAQSLGRFEAVFAHAAIGMVVCNEQGSIVLANAQAHRQFGYAPAGLPGLRIEALGPERPARGLAGRLPG